MTREEFEKQLNSAKSLRKELMARMGDSDEDTQRW